MDGKRRFWNSALPYGGIGLGLFVASLMVYDTMGVYFLLSGVGVLLLDIVFARPHRRKRFLAETSDLSLPFLSSETAQESPQALVTELQLWLKQSVAPDIELALITNTDGGMALITSQEVRQRQDANDPFVFSWISDRATPIWREDLKPTSDAGSNATIKLLDSFGASSLIPLHAHKSLIGVILVSSTVLTTENSSVLEYCGVKASILLTRILLISRREEYGNVSEILNRASVLQTSLMPEEILQVGHGWQLAGLRRPVTACGGDLWEWFAISDDKILIVIGDVTGHGAGPALLAAVVKGTLDAHVKLKGENCDPGRLLFALNKAVLHTAQRTIMMTAFAIVVDTTNNEIQFANAGHNFPFLLREDKLNVLVARGDQLGVSETPVFRTLTKSISPGDRIILYTDGVTEAGQEFGKEFGERRFRRLLSSLSTERIEAVPTTVFDAATAYVMENAAGATIQDDVTMIALEVTSN